MNCCNLEIREGVDVNFKQVKIQSFKTEAGELGGRYNKPMQSLQVELHKQTSMNSNHLDYVISYVHK